MTDKLDGKTPIRVVRSKPEPVATLTDVSYTHVIVITCKHCGSKNVVKYGKEGDMQHYLCYDCGRTFAGNNALPGMRFPPDQIASAVNLFYDGLSIDKIRRQLDSIYHVYPSDSTVYGWVVRFTKAAVDDARVSKVQVGDLWIADETVLDIGGRNVWFFDIIDDKTRFLLASRLTESRTTRDAQMLMDRARKQAGKSPKTVITDKLASYLDVNYGKGAEHEQGGPFSLDSNTNLIERFHGTLKSRTKIMRGLKGLETAHDFASGWLIHYNYFRPHESLDNKTPGSVAKADFPCKCWKDVVMKAGTAK